MMEIKLEVVSDATPCKTIQDSFTNTSVEYHTKNFQVILDGIARF